MANLITTLTTRLIRARENNKSFPCKTYATEAAAEKATAASALRVAQHFDRDQRDEVPEAEYVVFYVKDWDRWVGCINMGEVMRRPTSTGGYLGIEIGFFKY